MATMVAMPGIYSYVGPRPVKVLRGIPNHATYRAKLEEKWRRKGCQVRFA